MASRLSHLVSPPDVHSAFELLISPSTSATHISRCTFRSLFADDNDNSVARSTDDACMIVVFVTVLNAGSRGIYSMISSTRSL